MSSVYGDIFYGVHWSIPMDDTSEAETVLRSALKVEDPEQDFNDLLDTLSERHNAQIVFNTEGTQTVTIHFGHTICSVTEGQNDFDEMSLLRVMDLSKGVLREDIKEEVKSILNEVPFELREHLIGPGFNIAWGR